MSKFITAIKKMLGYNKTANYPLLPPRDVSQEYVEYFYHDRYLFIDALPNNPSLENKALLNWLLFNGELSNISSYAYSTIYLDNDGVNLNIKSFKSCPQSRETKDFTLFSLDKRTQKIECYI